MRLSSANSLTDDPIFSPMSLIYNKNINGSNTVPCGTPDLTLTDLDFSPSTKTFCSLVVNQYSSHPCILPLTPQWSIVSGGVWCEARCQKPCWNQGWAYPPVACYPSICWFLQLWLLTVFRKIFFSRKPCWKSANILWVSRCSMICLKIICSIILHGTDVKEIGL